MIAIGTPLKPGATRLLLLGSGELGKEVAIEAQRLGIEVIAVDRYDNAPAMQVAHRSHVVSMLDARALRAVIEAEQPDFVIPEVEAIATDELLELEAEGVCVIPTARATRLTMDREGIRRLAAEELNLLTSPYRFASSIEEYREGVAAVGLPCVVKPVMSSSGRGQSVVRDTREIVPAWHTANAGARGGSGRVIIEGFIDFDYEITLLTVRHSGGTDFCQPIGHLQIDGDYHESWQPQLMSSEAHERAHDMARAVTGELGGAGIFGVEMFVRGDDVYFSEVSPRPHDTGMVTMVSQELSEFALHVRAVLGLPIPDIVHLGPSASCAIVGKGRSDVVRYEGVVQALSGKGTTLRLFGKPGLDGHRRMGVALARGDSVEEARANARHSASAVRMVI